MGKFRSKLKRKHGGKTWGHGQSAISNPQNTKHRSKATSRFQAHLNLAPADSNALTPASLAKHDAQQCLAKIDSKAGQTINDIACSLRSFNLDADESMSQGLTETAKTINTFASNYTACTNMSFMKLLNGFRNNSPLHKEMLAILAALTDVIKQRGGTESSTEYFLVLMETLEASTADSEIIAALSLLNMGIRSVPEAVLRRKFSDCTTLLLNLMKQFLNVDNQNIVANILGPLAVILRAQEYLIWKLSSTLEVFESILPFTIHSKPKIRKAAQHAITSIVHGSCFLRTPKKTNDMENGDVDTLIPKINYHPAAGCVARFCLRQIKPENIANAQTLVLHTMVILRDCIAKFKTEDIKTTCECLISLMTATNVLLRTNCLQVMHSLFESKTTNLNATLTGKMLSAIYDFQPDKLDGQQTLAWLTVLKEGHICLASYDITMCIASLPRIIDICAFDLWLSDRTEIVTSTSNTIKELMIECIKPACETKQLADIHRSYVTKIINSLNSVLYVTFGHTATQVILTYAAIFDCTGRFFSAELKQSLSTIGSRYDVDSSLRLQIEHVVLAAISTMGVENVLKAVPLIDGNGDVLLTQSWILPLLREGIKESSLEYFAKNILPLVVDCHTKWHKWKAENNFPLAHTYELLYSQLWGLFPGFCRKPIDMFNFRHLARTLGTVLKENPEIRSSILDGLKELMTNVDDDGKNELARFAKNFLPILFNIYSTKPCGSYEHDLRKVTMNVIQEYLKVTPRSLTYEMFTLAMEQYENLVPQSFAAESVCDCIKQLAAYQSPDDLEKLFDNLVKPYLVKQQELKQNMKSIEKFKWHQRKAYQLLESILCVNFNTNEYKIFTENHIEKIQNLILKSGKITCKITHKARLNCINELLEKQAFSVTNSQAKKLIVNILPLYNVSLTNKGDNMAANLIIKLASMYQTNDELNDFIELLLESFKFDEKANANLITVIKIIISNFSGSLEVTTAEHCLDKVLQFLIGRNRQEVVASLAFLHTFAKTLPAPLVVHHLPTLIKSLSCMSTDTKRHCRIHIGYILRKFCKKFGTDYIVKLVPGNDEVTHKKLKSIRKQLNREKRLDAKNDENGNNEVEQLEKKSFDIDDILGDSESDFDIDDDSNHNVIAGRNKKKKTIMKNENYIQEDPGEIIDLADIQSIRHIRTTKPTRTTAVINDNVNSSTKDPNRGFKLATDGRLIIAEPKRKNQSSDDSEDDAENNGKITLQPTIPNDTKKRSFDTDSDSNREDENGKIPVGKKRKIKSSSTVVSGKTNISTSGEYVAGGKGIHRPLTSGQSVKSGLSSTSMATTMAASTVYGTEYKAKKASGDIKHKGKMDPYAYIPLSRNSLNKRKRVKNTNQFKNIVKRNRKGSVAGVKNKSKKDSRNRNRS